MKGSILKIISGMVAMLLIFAGGCSRQRQEVTEGKKILLCWSGYCYPVYDKFRAEESKKFEKENPNVIVRYEPIPLQYDSKILTRLASNTAPDMFFARDLSTYISKETLVDLTEWYNQIKTISKTSILL